MKRMHDFNLPLYASGEKIEYVADTYPTFSINKPLEPGFYLILFTDENVNDSYSLGFIYVGNPITWYIGTIIGEVEDARYNWRIVYKKSEPDEIADGYRGYLQNNTIVLQGSDDSLNNCYSNVVYIYKLNMFLSNL